MTSQVYLLQNVCMYVEILLMRMLFCWFCKASLEIPKLKYKLLSNYFSCIKFGVLKLFTFPIFYSFFFVTGKQNGLKPLLLHVCLFEWMSSITNKIGLLFFATMQKDIQGSQSQVHQAVLQGSQKEPTNLHFCDNSSRPLGAVAIICDFEEQYDTYFQYL